LLFVFPMKYKVTPRQGNKKIWRKRFSFNLCGICFRY